MNKGNKFIDKNKKKRNLTDLTKKSSITLVSHEAALSSERAS